MCSTIQSLDACGVIFQPELQVDTISTKLDPLPFIEFSNALRIAFFALRMAGTVCTALAGNVGGAFQSGGNFCHFQRIAMNGYITTIGAGGCLHANQRGRSHLPTGHSINGVVDKDDSNVFATI